MQGNLKLKRLLTFAVLAAIVWFGYTRSQSAQVPEIAVTPSGETRARAAPPQVEVPRPAAGQFSCDGRTHCSQMRSCAEATYFIKHCPNTQMDGNSDGVPCERQWCT